MEANDKIFQDSGSSYENLMVSEYFNIYREDYIRLRLYINTPSLLLGVCNVAYGRSKPS